MVNMRAERREPVQQEDEGGKHWRLHHVQSGIGDIFLLFKCTLSYTVITAKKA